MRVTISLSIVLTLSVANAFGQDQDYDNIARPQREQLAQCFLDTLKVVRKHQLRRSLADVLQAACAEEIQDVISVARGQLKDELMKNLAPSLAYEMLFKVPALYDKEPVSQCSGTGCSLNEYRNCLMRGMPAATRSKRKPIDFERTAQQQCEDTESAARTALTNDLDTVMKRYRARGFNHQVNAVVTTIVSGVRQNVVVLYGEDLIKVVPTRKSCKPEMCGASPCLSIVEQPTEYQCAIDQ